MSVWSELLGVTDDDADAFFTTGVAERTQVAIFSNEELREGERRGTAEYKVVNQRSCTAWARRGYG